MNIKRILCTLLALCLCFTFANASAWAAEEGCVYGEKVETQRGQTVCFPVSIKNNPGIAATMIQVSWESDDISIAYDSNGAARIQAGNVFKTGNTSSNYKEKSATFSWFGDANNTQNGTAFSIYFNVSDKADYGAYKIHVTCLQNQTINEKEEPVEIKSEDGEIVVVDPTPCIYGETVTAKQGTVVDYHVYIKNNPGISAVAFYLKPECADGNFEAVLDEGTLEVDLGTFSQNGTILASKFEDGWKVLWYTTEKDQTGDGSIFSLKIKVPDTAEGTYPITITPLTENIVDEDGIKVEIPKIESGNVNAYKIYYGDVDGNKKVDLADALYLKRLLAGWNGYKLLSMECTDVNQDNVIDLEDIITLEKHLAGWKGYEKLPMTAEI